MQLFHLRKELTTLFINKKDRILIKRAIQYIKPYKIRFFFAFITILSGIIADIIQPLMWAKLLVNLFSNNFSKVVNNILLITIVFLVNSLIGLIRSYLTSYLSQQIIFDLKKDIYNRILNLPIKAFDKMRTGDFMSRLEGDVGGVADIITNQLINTIVEILRVIIIGIVIFSIDIRLALIVLVCFPITFVIYHKFGVKIRKENESFFELNDNYFSHIHQTISGIREIKSLGANIISFKNFLELSTNLKVKGLKINIISSVSQMISRIVNFSSEIIVMLVGGYFVYMGTLTMENFIAFTSYSAQFSNSLLSVTQINASIQQVLTSLERIFGLLDNLNYGIEPIGKQKLKKVNGSIVFKNVSFQYDEETRILNNINLNIPANKKIAIVGQSGSGKTTLFNLLLRFYRPTKGIITIDGIPLFDIDETSLRENFAIVHQEPYFMTLSIKENLKLASPEATDKDLIEACKLAYIHDFIDSLPDKYDTVLGENGITLSGGQRQRLAIARVLLRNARIILFDEATSALDNESQIKIKDAIDQIAKKHTVLIIAHRLVTVLEADEIIVMSNGEVVGFGSHNSLIKDNKIYQKLYKSEITTITSAPKVVGG